jgi:hypothetical protein
LASFLERGEPASILTYIPREVNSMKHLRSVQLAVLVVALTASPVMIAKAGAQQMPPTPKPGPEHEILKMDVGTWDASVELIPGPGAAPMTSKGVEVNALGCGGMCLITDFKGEFMPGVTFQGHGVMTWDAVKKKYVGSWTDSMSGGLSLSEGTYDAAAKKATGSMEGRGMTGEIIKSRTVVEYKGTDSRVMTAYMPGPDGKEMQSMRITYTRRK